MEDDWAMEQEMLQSIFMDQYIPGRELGEFEVQIFPKPDEGEANNNVGICFSVTFTKGYPEQLPHISLKSIKTITSKQCTELHAQVMEAAQEMIGTQMIYSLTQIVKDFLDDADTDAFDKQKEADKISEEKELEREREEYKRDYIKDGTSVTRESFVAWFEKFLVKHPEKQIKVVTQTKLTGRQIFEQSPLDNLESETDKMQIDPNANVDWALFQGGEEDFDIDDEELIDEDLDEE